MTVSQQHITAGDITPVTVYTESTFGTPSGAASLYGDVAEGGKFTFKDTANPYVSWRYGSRSFNIDNYVTRQKDAAFSAVLEARDTLGWASIINNAVGIGGTTSGEPLLPSRSEEINVKMADGKFRGRQYNGCKTDKLTIKADAPGGIVTFEEDVIAMKSATTVYNTADASWSGNSDPAVQWMNGITVSGNDIYPQSFQLSISNNLDRIRVASPSDGAVTGSIPEGRRDIQFQAEVWMEGRIMKMGARCGLFAPDTFPASLSCARARGCSPSRRTGRARSRRFFRAMSAPEP